MRGAGDQRATEEAEAQQEVPWPQVLPSAAAAAAPACALPHAHATLGIQILVLAPIVGMVDRWAWLSVGGCTTACCFVNARGSRCGTCQAGGNPRCQPQNCRGHPPARRTHSRLDQKREALRKFLEVGYKK